MSDLDKAIKKGNNLGSNPANPTVKLPNVPNGLGIGGLKVSPLVATDSTKWTGAELPTQKIGKHGRTKVTIKQPSQQALLNWETFNVGKKTTLTFDQSKGGENAGQWIAWNAERTEILAHGRDMASVHDEAVRKGEPMPLLQRVCRPDRILIG